MDEMTVIRDVLDAPPPAASITFRARNRLTDAIEASRDATDPMTRSSTGRTSTTGHRRRWWGSVPSLVGGVALAGVLAVVLIVTQVTGGGGPAPEADAPAPAQLSAHDLLLAAAGRAESAPATTGRYWHVRTVGVTGPYPVGTEPNRYDLVGRTVVENWTARDPAGKSWEGHRELGYRPRSEADQRAWAAAGSPDHWDIAVDTTEGVRRLSTTPGEPRLAQNDDPVRYLGGFDVAGLAALPGNPAQLRTLLVERIAADPGYAAGTPESDVVLFGQLSQLLLDAPAPPQVRAAAFTVLADVPHVRSIGEARDAEGRPGVGIQLDRTAGTVTQRHTIVIDPTTFLVLGHEYVATAEGKADRPIKQGKSVVLTAEWTDREPTPPAIP